jgi:ankyrin repeat protein
MVEYLNRVRSDGLTALGIAIEQSSLLMTTVLCEAGADINRYDAKTKQSPVSLCLKLNSPDIVNYLLS